MNQIPSQDSPDPKKEPRSPLSGVLPWSLLIGTILLMVGISWVREQTLGSSLKYGEFVKHVEKGVFTAENVEELKFSNSEIRFKGPVLEKEEAKKDGEPGSVPEKTEVAANEKSETEGDAEKILRAYRVPIGGIPDESRAHLEALLREKEILISGSDPDTDWGTLISILLMSVIILSTLYFIRRIGGPGAAMSFGRSRAKLFADDDVKVTFADVAGIEEAVNELREVVEFLKTPGKYQALGGRIPRGVLLVGPPGTGKTLLAKAVAGEAGVPFFSLSGSDFVEMFVGVGAARVRDMFAQAVQRAPAIIFIDELDALGKARGSGQPGSHDEREQTLNALLVEMDGFGTDQSVIVMGATNRPETLDPALMRPGRFDRHVLVDRPDFKGREAILKVHAQKIKMGEDVNLMRIAKLTVGFVGADLASLVNEAALLAARNNKTEVSMNELEEAVERVIAGLEKSSRLINEEEKQRVAYHESGHALIACSLPHTAPVHKVSIIPRGFGALGYVLQRPNDDRHLVTETELVNRICVALGGIAAEELIFSETSTGPSNDLEQATEIARRMVMDYGMSPKLGRVNYREAKSSPFLKGASLHMATEVIHSQETIREIDLEIRRIMDECLATTREILANKKAALEEITQALLEREVMNGDEIHAILDGHKKGPQLKPGTSVTRPGSATDDSVSLPDSSPRVAGQE
ncbi:MAG: ATP-dependent zinc metalloprotease FtsH [Planctomycetaceae bacterium]|nr:ATP-dependent zinc metalloprotease FtsH [Planctomycetaceae bacterium]MCB9950822.1 ATP-dependent zinc metalloprotease FtsH [Planctomycetaceae bacterium]